MDREIRRYLQLYSAGEITLTDCVWQIRSILEVACNADSLKTVAMNLPPDVFSALQDDVDKAPASTEDWARFRLISFGYMDTAATVSQIENGLAESQARYYRFVTAWRDAFPEDVPAS